VDADHTQPVVRVALVPRLQVWERPQRVDAAEVPELDEHGTPALLLHSQWRDVDPRQVPGERGRGDGVLGRAHGAEASSGFAGFPQGPAQLWRSPVFYLAVAGGRSGLPMFIPFRGGEFNLRKLITVAVVATASLALVGSAIADPNDDPASLKVTVSPKDSGTSKKPKNVKLTFGTKVNLPGTTVNTIQVLLPSGLKFSGKGFKKCKQGQPRAQRPDRLPRRLEGRADGHVDRSHRGRPTRRWTSTSTRTSAATRRSSSTWSRRTRPGTSCPAASRPC
jgi:hypothetical protein